MSYILDALKKSEQARGGRKSRKMFEELPELPAQAPASSGSSRRWLYIIAFILVLNASFFVFRAGPRHSTTPPPIAKISRAPSPKPQAPGNLAAAPAAPAKPAGNMAGTAVRPTAPKPIAKISRAKSPPAKPAGKLAAAPTAPPPRKNLPAHKPAAQGSGQPGRDTGRPAAARLKALLERQAERVEKTAKPGSHGENLADIRDLAPPDSSSEPGAPGLWQLPPQVRETLPAISVSMLVYSKQPADRFIYINGSKRREGDEISPGLKLKRITPDGAIFTYRGLRFYKSVMGN